MTTSKTTMTSIRFLPKWIWWLAFIYIMIAIATYVGAFPIRYSQLVGIHGLETALIQIAIEYLSIIILGMFSFFLLLNRGNEFIAVLVSVTIFVGPPNFIGLSHLSVELHPIFYILSGIIFTFLSSLVFLSLISMPDGYPRPRWMVWLLPPFLVYDFFRYMIFFALGPPEIQALRPVVFTINGLLILMSGITMIWRYRYHSTTTQKQQFKWLFFGINCFFSLLIILQAIRFLAWRFSQDIIVTTSLYTALAITIGGTILCITLMLAITRYGLWDIDLTINRSVVASIITLLLLFIFGVILWLSQGVMRGILGEAHSEIAVLLAALVAGSAFNPVRVRVRSFVDRKLYGFRFDLNQLKRHKEKIDIKNPGAFTGRILDGYELLDVIGRGNIGEVYKGIKDDHVVAIKILQASYEQDDAMRLRFEREGKIALNHPNIVKTLGAGEQDGIFYIIMEYVEGQTLKDLLKQRNRLTLEDLSDYLYDLGNAIDYAHAQGYVHRDIKPSNIILKLRPDNETYDAVLMDFGIAKILGDTSSLTGSAAVGTIDYMAPEQIRSATSVDYRADIYALGVVIYETLSGTLPFRGTMVQVMFAHVHQPPPNILSFAPNLPWQIADVLDRALEKKPDNRFQSASEFVQTLLSGA